MDTEIIEYKAHITLADGSVWQVLDKFGEFDEAATALAVAAYLENLANAP